MIRNSADAAIPWQEDGAIIAANKHRNWIKFQCKSTAACLSASSITCRPRVVLTGMTTRPAGSSDCATTSRTSRSSTRHSAEYRRRLIAICDGPAFFMAKNKSRILPWKECNGILPVANNRSLGFFKMQKQGSRPVPIRIYGDIQFASSREGGRGQHTPISRLESNFGYYVKSNL